MLGIYKKLIQPLSQSETTLTYTIHLCLYGRERLGLSTVPGSCCV